MGVATLRRLKSVHRRRGYNVRGGHSRLPRRRCGCNPTTSLPRSLLMSADRCPLPTPILRPLLRPSTSPAPLRLPPVGDLPQFRRGQPPKRRPRRTTDPVARPRGPPPAAPGTPPTARPRRRRTRRPRLSRPPDAAGDAASGSGSAQPAAVRHAHKRLHELTLRTTLGEVAVERTAYAATGAAQRPPPRRATATAPARLQLPAATKPGPLRRAGSLRRGRG